MPESCPKCGTARDARRAHCATCGLAHVRMAAFAKVRDAVPDVLTVAWQRVLERWDDPARHDALLRLITQHDAYAWAAARYRERLDARGDDVARAQLERLRRAAEATLLVTAAARRTETATPYKNTIAVMILLVIVLVAGLVYVMARGSKQQVVPSREPVPPSETN
ncbi:MAG TPA: hypothetical protein VK427_15675 [Kofleriaceae bacterium]|nr:hypothetical protein [Kofleriaceae bacterium]